MIIHREIGSSYHHKPIVQGVDNSPLMMESDVDVLVEEERPPEEKYSANIPPAPNYRLSVSWFSISAAVRLEEKYPEVYIGFFRSS